MAKLDDRYVAKAKKLVSEKFPEMSDAKPTISEKCSQSKVAAADGRDVKARYVLTFEKDVSLPGGSELKRFVRVTMDDSGEVLRLSSSK